MKIFLSFLQRFSFLSILRFLPHFFSCRISFLAVFFLSFLSVVSGDELFQEIVVAEGDTLWGIAGTYLKDSNRWPEILKANRITLTDLNFLSPGMRLKIPLDLAKERHQGASLVSFLRDVKYRRKNQTIWNVVEQGMGFYSDDELKTIGDSQVHVQFLSQDVLKLYSDTSIVFKPDLKRREITLNRGSLLVTGTKVITPTAEVMPVTRDSLFKAFVRYDDATAVQVGRGSAEVLGLDTKVKVIVPEGYVNITRHKQDPTSPIPVPSIPELQITESKPKEKVKDELALPIGEWKYYRLQLSQNPNFSKIERDEKSDLRSGALPWKEKNFNLPDGQYYRRVSYFDVAGRESRFFDLPPLIVNTHNPDLAITAPEDGIRTYSRFMYVEGLTTPGTIVTVNGYPVEVKSDGKFSWSVVLSKEGEMKIRVVAKDLNDNKTILERTVYKLGK